MGCVSITCVGAFDIVGTILIVALIITPPATAYLLTRQLRTMIGASILIGCLWLFLNTSAIAIDGSIAGANYSLRHYISIFVFTQSWFNSKASHSNNNCSSQPFYSPSNAKPQQPNQNEFEFSLMNLTDHMKWSNAFAQKVISHAIAKNYITYQNPHYSLTPNGIEVAKNAMTES